MEKGLLVSLFVCLLTNNVTLTYSTTFPVSLEIIFLKSTHFIHFKGGNCGAATEGKLLHQRSRVGTELGFNCKMVQGRELKQVKQNGKGGFQDRRGSSTIAVTPVELLRLTCY